mmetsp:Transcript_14921/g.35567  ORF Transcript_14921/g.35567 Transcript_14921/m.35567 type:complete len:261 (+) Transcript_14921:426-1208(+)
MAEVIHLAVDALLLALPVVLFLPLLLLLLLVLYGLLDQRGRKLCLLGRAEEHERDHLLLVGVVGLCSSAPSAESPVQLLLGLLQLDPALGLALDLVDLCPARADHQLHLVLGHLDLDIRHLLLVRVLEVRQPRDLLPFRQELRLLELLLLGRLPHLLLLGLDLGHHLGGHERIEGVLPVVRQRGLGHCRLLPCGPEAARGRSEGWLRGREGAGVLPGHPDRRLLWRRLRGLRCGALLGLFPLGQTLKASSLLVLDILFPL